MVHEEQGQRPERDTTSDGAGREPREPAGGADRGASEPRRERAGRRDAPRGGRDERRGSGPRGPRRDGDERRGGPRGDRRGSGPRGPRREGEDRRGPARGDRDGARATGGSRLAAKSPRLPEPRIPDEVTGKEIDRSIHQQLRTLSKENADGVAKHLVMVAVQLEADDIEAALAHAETAVRRAGRVPAAREALGMVAYRMGDFSRALTEFRTVRRLSGSSHLLPLMVDCERGLGRHDRALDLAASPEAATLTEAERIELAIVVSGVRRDLGQDDAALLALQVPALRRGAKAGVHRLHYAYADALLHLGREDEAREWFLKAVEGDTDNETDAVERLEELDGISMSSHDEDDDELVDLAELGLVAPTPPDGDADAPEAGSEGADDGSSRA